MAPAESRQYVVAQEDENGNIEPPKALKDAIIDIGWCMLWVCLINFTSVFFLQFMTAMAGAGITKRIREQSYAAILRMEMAFFDKPENSPGITLHT